MHIGLYVQRESGDELYRKVTKQNFFFSLHDEPSRLCVVDVVPLWVL